MLAAGPAADAVYFVDDHFVPYTGARPVAKGWNTKRRRARPGRDDTLVVDARGRAVLFGSGEPTSLASNLPGVLAQLRQVLGPHAPILLGFDRGGSYPCVFTTCRDAGADWVSYRRAPLAAATANPTAATITRRRAGAGDARRRDRADQGLRPRPPAHLVRTRRARPAGVDERHDRHRGRAAVLAPGPVADREHVLLRRRAGRHRRVGRLRHGHRPRHP